MNRQQKEVLLAAVQAQLKDLPIEERWDVLEEALQEAVTAKKQDTLNLQLQIDIVYELNGASPKDIICMLEGLAQNIANHGHFTNDSPAVVGSYSSNVHVWEDEDVKVRGD